MKNRDENILNTLRSLDCDHRKNGDCIDQNTGDIFCGDCGNILIPWSKQTERQHATYVWMFGKEPQP